MMVLNDLRNKVLYLVVVVLLFAGAQSVDAQKSRRTVPASAVTETTKPEIKYTVSMSKPWTHLLEVEMKLKPFVMPDQTEVKMAVWTPGSYLVREYARHVQDFVVLDDAGRALDWRKINKNTWQIDSKGAKELRIGYQVYANELTVRTNELNYEHAFFTPAALLMYPKGHLDAPSTIEVIPYGNWRVATGLKPIAVANSYKAPNFDVLFDSPFEVSDFTERNFTVRGVPHRYVFTGEGNYDLDKIVVDTTKIIEQTVDIFGEIPYEDYTFIVNLRGGGGLEHLNSTALQWNKYGFQPQQRYEAFLALVAHEYFHLYNVKRIRPEPLGPFDYENENYTKLLWVAEGATSYYEGILMRRGGLVSAGSVLQSKAGIAESLQREPGRFQTSLEEASFDAWIKYYRRDENSVNNQISYYSKGELVNFLLDIQIRSLSGGTKSMDDVMRHLYAEFFKKDRTYSPADFQKACEMMAGSSLESFFSKYVSGREELDYDALLAPMGLRMVALRPETDSAHVGASFRPADGGMTVTSVPAGTAAYESGLNTDDLLVAVDGNQITSQTQLGFFVGLKKAGEKATFTVFRHNKMRDIEITYGRTPASNFTILPVPNPSEAQKSLYQLYLNDSLN